MKIYPILNNLGKGKYVFIFILNERAVEFNRFFDVICAFHENLCNFAHIPDKK